VMSWNWSLLVRSWRLENEGLSWWYKEGHYERKGMVLRVVICSSWV
jgi:hypothetical protein